MTVVSESKVGYSTGTADSLPATGTAAAPAAATAFVSLAAPPAGIYTISGVYAITGVLEVIPKNVRLNRNALAFTDFLSSAGVAAVIVFTIPQVALDGVNVVTLTAIANATAATVYTGTLVATRIG